MTNPLREGKEKYGRKEPSDRPRPTNPPPSEGNPQRESQQFPLAAAIETIDSRVEGFRTCAAYLLERLGRESLGESSQPIMALLKSFVDSSRVARREMMKREGQGAAAATDLHDRVAGVILYRTERNELCEHADIVAVLRREYGDVGLLKELSATINEAVEHNDSLNTKLAKAEQELEKERHTRIKYSMGLNGASHHLGTGNIVAAKACIWQARNEEPPKELTDGE